MKSPDRATFPGHLSRHIQQATQIARLEELARQADLDPEFAKAFLNFIIQEVIHHHKKHQS